MKLQKILNFAHSLLQSAISNGDIAVDATVGNGHDTEMLAKLVGESGHVYGFDVQEDAISNTRKRLNDAQLDSRVTLFTKGHETIKESIPKDSQPMITAAIFNLGYLPGGNKNIVTHSNTTISAIEQLLEIMPKEGMIILVVYHGHPEGAMERDELLEYVVKLDQRKAHVLRYEFMNQVNHPPFIIAIEKR
ncbi:tRNA (mnm(5)s(2)U34)-methyltransferase [Heyndrickxia camelliae]|uniref:16S rRNA (Cytosine(1402)-N(4))-methyltransferase n=1 Tax=Heyndrickxia camelliae TaxID=1707093 RepID=A0A2N3LIE7_9BACI|nr:class I SAM-dependent methyltransferase [Heyndrickxia camelliae]PKR84365.1 16S rRNA (cytosine(1402)-N(4))-methyltransferase [Heyndrickxia camelliae]